MVVLTSLLQKKNNNTNYNIIRKVHLPLCLTKYHAMEMNVGVEV
jgi:hypothetical protein